MAKASAVTKTEDEVKSGTSLEAYGAYAEYAGAGFENQTNEDYALPFIGILQALSPILQERDDLKQGMIINTVTGEATQGKDGIAFIPATTAHEYVEFRPRDAGGGFVGRHAIDSDIVKAAKEASTEYGDYKTADGNELTETFNVYGILVNPDGTGMEAVIAFSSSKIKKYKAWMTKAKTIQFRLPDGRQFPAPLFAHRYRLKTTTEKNPKGTFFNWDISFDGASAMEARLTPDNPLFQSAVAIKQLLDSGAVRANYEAAAKTGDGNDSGAAGGKPVF